MKFLGPVLNLCSSCSASQIARITGLCMPVSEWSGPGLWLYEAFRRWGLADAPRGPLGVCLCRLPIPHLALSVSGTVPRQQSPSHTLDASNLTYFMTNWTHQNHEPKSAFLPLNCQPCCHSDQYIKWLQSVSVEDRNEMNEVSHYQSES